MIFTLLDGTNVDSTSEAWRHECEARHIARMPLEARREYLEHVQKRRGESAAARLRDTLAALWAKRKELTKC